MRFLMFTCRVNGDTVANFRHAQDVWPFCERQPDPVIVVQHTPSGNRATTDVFHNGEDSFFAWVNGADDPVTTARAML